MKPLCRSPGIYVGDGMVIHFTRAADREIGTGTFLDKVIVSSSPVPTDTVCERCGDQRKLHGVIRSCVDCFLAGDHLYIFKYNASLVFFFAQARGGTCAIAPSDSASGVLHRANYLLGKGFGVYNLFKNNCEDFAIYCKTCLLIRSGRSSQWASWTSGASTIIPWLLRFVTTSTGGFVLVAGSIYLVNRYAADIGIRRDVVKIPVERLVVEAGGSEHPIAGEAQVGE